MCITKIEFEKIRFWNEIELAFSRKSSSFTPHSSPLPTQFNFSQRVFSDSNRFKGVDSAVTSTYNRAALASNSSLHSITSAANENALARLRERYIGGAAAAKGQ
ncbi:hypothetical protein TSAR_003322, partial [Trichomalopsis sarcophagae]